MSLNGNLCECGCGEGARGTNRFVKGHNRRGLVSFTSNGRWSMDWDCCIGCGTTKTKHYRDGYCNNCARKLLRSGGLERKRDLTGGRWSREFDCCQGCGTVEREHHARGFCGTCLQEQRARVRGAVKRVVGKWSLYYEKCLVCGSLDKPHVGHGLCYDCYEAKKREGKIGVVLDSFITCSICGAKVLKYQQHLSMKSHTCIKHLELYNRFYNDIVSLFSSELSSSQVALKYNIFKERVLNIWHENYTEEEIRSRGKKIGIKKISGERHYLYGAPAPLVSNNLINFEDKNGGFHVMRSTWEVKYAEYLDIHDIEWEYEKYKFKYADVDSGSHYYFPDFYLPKTKEFVEIKGYMDAKSEFKILECVKNYNLKIVVLRKEDLKQLGLNV